MNFKAVLIKWLLQVLYTLCEVLLIVSYIYVAWYNVEQCVSVCMKFILYVILLENVVNFAVNCQ
jgi:hypothetical protein